MAFCKNCGSELIANAKFCQKCGCPTVNENGEKRKQEYAGKIIKCPRCGESLASFQTICPTCGHEIREYHVSSVVKEFSSKLEAIDALPILTQRRVLFKNNKSDELTEREKRKIDLIRNFPIPNTKEDLFEFIILASSNINAERYDDYETMSESKKSVSDAWAAKFEQAYEKAKLSFGKTFEFERIQTIYLQKHKEISTNQKKGSRKKRYLYFGIALMLLAEVLIFVFIFSNDSRKIAAENERLEGIVQEIYGYIEREEYSLARAKASTLVFSGSTTKAGNQASEKWDKTRAEIMKTISEAEKGQDTLSSPSSEEFTQDFSSEVQSGAVKSKENIDKFNEIMNGTMQQSPKPVPSEASKAIEPESSNNTSHAVDFSANVIEKGAAYSFGHDEFNLYFATAISDKLIKIEKWGKHLATDKSFSLEYEVGAYKITDPANGFTWLDNLHTAFRFILQDEKNGDYRKPQEVIFTVSGSDGDTNKGTNYSEDVACFSYANDDWHIYKAIPLTDAIIKVECWYRPLAFGNFSYGYDICITGAGSDETDFEWTADEHTSFTITLKDENNSDLKKGTFVAFTLE